VILSICLSVLNIGAFWPCLQWNTNKKPHPGLAIEPVTHRDSTAYVHRKWPKRQQSHRHCHFRTIRHVAAPLTCPTELPLSGRRVILPRMIPIGSQLLCYAHRCSPVSEQVKLMLCKCAVVDPGIGSREYDPPFHLVCFLPSLPCPSLVQSAPLNTAMGLLFMHFESKDCLWMYQFAKHSAVPYFLKVPDLQLLLYFGFYCIITFCIVKLQAKIVCWGGIYPLISLDPPLWLCSCVCVW